MVASLNAADARLSGPPMAPALQIERIAHFLEADSPCAIKRWIRATVARLNEGLLAHAPVIEQILTLFIPLGQDLLALLRSSNPAHVQRAGQLLGLELEGLSAEDQAFEVVRQYLRLLEHTVAAMGPVATGPQQVRSAFRGVVHADAPGLPAHWMRATQFQGPPPGAPEVSLASSYDFAALPRPSSGSTSFSSGERTMHNLDRILNQQETFQETPNMTGMNEYAPEIFNEFNQEYAQEFGAGSAGEYNEAELAAELLMVNSEAEMEQFFGKLISSAARGLSGFARSNVGRALGSVLKQAAKSALPAVGAALGSAIPIPGVGTAIGSMAGKALANALEAEMGATQGEARDFEVAQQLVRMAHTATQQAAASPNSAAPGQVAASAVKAAVQSTLAGRGLASAGVPAAMGVRRNQGRWIRRGNSIILLGV